MLNSKNLSAVCFGEVLYDVFPNEKKIGGAPLNLALRLASFGIRTSMISAIGNDEDGMKLKDYVAANDVDNSLIQINDAPTGHVDVTLDERGSAKYDIVFPSAWDYIESSDRITDRVKSCDLFFYGSLAARSQKTKETLSELLTCNEKMTKIFDVNLRPPHYTIDTISQLMTKASFIKFNDDEILAIAANLGFISNDIDKNILYLKEKFSVTAICVTKGKHGAVLHWDNKFYYQKPYSVKVVDTVGAGDSFLAALVYKLYTGENPQLSLDFAGAVGALTATTKGANPTFTSQQITEFIEYN